MKEKIQKNSCQKSNSSIQEDSSRDPVIKKIYDYLLDVYGPQGWWPLTELHVNGGSNPTKTGSVQGYHPGDYTYPRNRTQQFEIICGALLTQNTSWPQVETALLNLKKLKALSPEGILALDPETLKEAIRPAGYYNQKAGRLKALAEWFSDLQEKTPERSPERSTEIIQGIPSREELLCLKGVGPETADSILLYAFKRPSFVVDAYTRRITANLGLAGEKAKYDEIKALFEENLPEDTVLYQEYHAMLVEHAKRHYKKKGAYGECPLLKIVGD
ncbi:Endonuclease III [Methanosarcina sp. MTP4]|uniref:endonuclease III domain-containing protein n=1 Tax=Methanosarcina sp. MTP4 TaxID=1434100 RepID=UPI00061550F4|nr:endonuclease III domain-containing protein [Methanosarcina sp. MTP4]AKB25161.1 Endonuclease III [Methanosarcina sp. MTP4]